MSTFIKKNIGNSRYEDSDSLEVSFFVERDLKPEEYKTVVESIKTLEKFVTTKKEEE